jgi:uncharacterized cupredoxin-like copper-binding protein
VDKAVEMLIVLLTAGLVSAGGDPGRGTPTPLTVEFGSAAHELIAAPAALALEAGRPYRLTLVNGSRTRHELTVARFAQAVRTHQVLAGDARLEGSLRGLVLAPRAQAAWDLVPLRRGVFEIGCGRPEHREAGMVSRILVR